MQSRTRPFLCAWLSCDPNDPSIADPELIDPNVLMRWSPRCNLADTGASEYMIDLADLEIFISDTPWLWAACWKLEEIEAPAAAVQSQSQNLMSMPLNAYSLDAEIEDSEPEVSVDTLIQVIDFIDEVIADEPDNLVNIQGMRAILADQLQAILDEE